MERLERAGVLLALTGALRENGGWCGETQVQKATYFLQALLRVPLGYRFILYKYGPFSFDLRDELSGMYAERFLQLEPKPYPFGPSLVDGPASSLLRNHYPEPARGYASQITFVAQKLGTKGAPALEKLATALYVTLEGVAAREGRAARIHELKPHVSLAEAQAAVAEVDALAQEAAAIAVPEAQFTG